MNKIVYIIISLIFTLYFTACSSESTPTKKAPKTVTGLFLDSAVSNLSYNCSSWSATDLNQTDTLGQFTCNEDDNISFYIGKSLYLATLKVDTIITPLSLYPDDMQKVLNLIQLLQTLDKDNNPQNGIDLDNSLITKIEDANLSFGDANFDAHVEESLGVSLISSEDAYANFSQTLKELGQESFEVDFTTPTILNDTTISIYENQEEITTILASDNTTLSYSINTDKSTNPSNFFIDSKSGELRFTFIPNYETQSSYTVTIDVSDGVNISSKEFTINILNIDENPPKIDTDSVIIVEEGQLKVTTIDATDENPLSYSISGKDSDFFNLDTSTAEITFKNLADYELQKSYEITISASDGINTTSKDITILLLDIQETDIPVLAIIMNWTDYTQTSASLWHNKLFDPNSKSVTAWYSNNTDGEVNLFPVEESSGTQNDGIIIVDMGVPHPGAADEELFRDVYLRGAITDSEVVNNVDFAKYDTNKDGNIDMRELQILFIVAGGEESYGDDPSHSVWALSWSFDTQNAPIVDDVTVMKYIENIDDSGSYLLFGAEHGNHTATIGIIAHELGHSLFNLMDYYDDGGGSGLGYYDIMSGGSWAAAPSDIYDGATPTQFSIFNKRDANFLTDITTVNTSTTLTIKCSSKEGIKLQTPKEHEYFLIECRDTQNENSDISFYSADYAFANKLFTAVYHVDDAKDFEGYFIHSNTEDGPQTSSHHYNVSLLEKDKIPLMTDTEYIEADFSDVYMQGDFISSSEFQLYDGTWTGFSVEILNEDYIQRSVEIKITKTDSF